MRATTSVFTTLALCAFTCMSDAKQQDSACVLAITHVNLISMTKDQVQTDKTVRFSRTEILEISDKASAAEGCQHVIDGSDQYLLPGLNDMHTHVENEAFMKAFGQEPKALPLDALMTPYLLNSVTGIRVMSGSPDLLAYRDRVKGGNMSPHMVVASPMLSAEPPVLPEPITRIVDHPDTARTVVRQYAAAGYDLIKIRRNLAWPVLQAIIDEAHASGLHVDGHVSVAAGSVDAVITSGQDGFAHLDELAIRLNEDWDLASLTTRLIECGCYVSTALGVMPNISQQINHYDELIARDEMQIMFPLLTNAFWLKPNNPYLQEGAPSAFFDDLTLKTWAVVKPLYDAGVPILAGSDALNPMIVPGYGMLDELDHLVAAGLTPFEALRTATVIPAESVPGFERLGVLERGRVPNAVLVSTNPFQDLSVLRRPVAVILNGYILDREHLNQRLEESIKTARHP